MKYSQVIVNNGYNLGCMMMQYKNYDFVKSPHLYPAWICNEIHPYEAIFYKRNFVTTYNSFLKTYMDKNIL